MAKLEFDCLPTIIGSLPHTDPERACALVARYLRDIPAWPQLPQRAFEEHMDAQYAEGFPGIAVDAGAKRVFVDRRQDLARALEAFYTAYLANDTGKYPTSPDYAAGLHAFLRLANLAPRAVKGQVAGPITWGMTVTDEERRPIIYDETLADVVPKFLRLKATWQEAQLSRISKNTIIFVDEPYLTAFGSVGFMLSKEQVISHLEEVFSGIRGLKGVHCCGNTDWSILMGTSVNILSFDAYNYAQSLTLYPAEVKRFLARGEVIAWGIVPTNAEALVKEDATSLRERLEEAMAPFTRQGVPFPQLVSQGLLTPSCGLASIASEELAERALELLVELSAEIRRRYR